MTEKLYDINSHLKEFTATVVKTYCENGKFSAVLDRTAFFPEGGGQASDTGFINGIRVYDVQEKDGIIYHYTDETLNEGDKVNALLDWERRFDFMQQHTAEHIVSGVAHRLFGCENVGFHLGEDIVTLDFDRMLDAEQIVQVEKEANEAVYRNAQVKAYYPDAKTLQELSYRSKKELEGAVRIVEIEDTDVCACCAPHVDVAGEIGLIKLLGGEKLRGGIRLELKAGRRALEDYNQKYDNVRKISALLCVKQHETAEAVERVLEQSAELRSELNNLKRLALQEKIRTFEPQNSITAEFENGMEMKDLQHFADSLYKKAGGIRAAFSEANGGFSFAVCGDEEKLAEFFADFKSRFAVKGGGRGSMMQGTVTCSKEDIIQFIESK